MSRIGQEWNPVTGQSDSGTADEDQLLDITLPAPSDGGTSKSSGRKTSKSRIMTPEPRGTGKWSALEDQSLMQIKANNPNASWSQIARMISEVCGTSVKNPGSVSQHYNRTLTIDKREWTAAEDAILKEYFQQYGNKWASIGKHLQGRSDLQIKYRIHVLRQNGSM